MRACGEVEVVRRGPCVIENEDPPFGRWWEKLKEKLRCSYCLEVANLFFHQVGQIWSYRALVKAPESSRRDLAIEKGFRACF